MHRSIRRPRVERALALLALLIALAPMARADLPLRLLTPPDATAATPVQVDIGDVQIFSIREQDEVYELSGRLFMQWTDPRQAFDADALGASRLEYQGEAATDMLDKQVWWPEFEFGDARGPRERIAVNLTLDADGTVHYRERFLVEIKQDFDLEDFPFDEHVISFLLEPFTYDSSAVRYVISESGVATTNWEPTEWLVQDPEIMATNFPAHYCRTDDGTESAWFDGPCSESSRCDANSECLDQHHGFPRITVWMEIARVGDHYVSNIIVPLVLIVLIAAAVFWMDLRTTHLGDRLALPFTSILTVVAFDLVTAGDLPKLWYATTLDRIVSASYVLVAANIGLVVLIDRLASTGHEAGAGRLNRIMRWLFPATYIACLVWIIA